MQIYWAEDVARARETLTASYARERSELQATAEKFRGFANDLAQFRNSLFASGGGSGGYAAQLKLLRSTGGMAALGDERAIGNLPGVAKSFLDSALNNASSAVDYQRDLARVVGYVDRAIGGANGMASAADAQIRALESSVEGLIDLNENVVTVHDAVADLNRLLTEPTISIADSGLRQVDVLSDIRIELSRTRGDLGGLNDDLRIALTTISGSLARLASVISAADGGGALNVRTDGDDVVKVNQI
jgi:hypothetical protein